MRSCGKRQQHVEGARGERGHGPDLDEARLAHDAAGAPPRRRAMRRASSGGGRAARATARSARTGTGSGRGSRAAARRRRRSRAASRCRRLGARASSRLRFSNLPRSPGSRGVQLHVVARARELARASRRASARCSGRSTPSTSTLRVGGSRRAASASRSRCPGEPLARVERGVRERAPRAVEAADGSARARQEVIRLARAVRAVRGAGGARAGRRGARRRALAQGLAQPPGAVRDHRQARGTAAAQHVPDAARERQRLAPRRGRRAPARVEAPRGAPAGVGGPRERAQPRVGAGAAVLDSCAGDVAARALRAYAREAVPATPARRRRSPARRRRRRPARARCAGSPCWRPTRSARRCRRGRGRAW